jgi:hypothetical protein
MIISMKILKRIEIRHYISILRSALMVSGLFFIILPSVFEIHISIPSNIYLFFFTGIGAFLFGGIKFLTLNSYIQLDKNANAFFSLYKYIFAGFLSVCILSILIIPVMGIIDIFPALGIICLSSVILISS